MAESFVEYLERIVDEADLPIEQGDFGVEYGDSTPEAKITSALVWLIEWRKHNSDAVREHWELTHPDHLAQFFHETDDADNS